MVTRWPPGFAVTVYEVTGSPLSTKDGVQDTYAEPSAGVTASCAGGSGTDGSATMRCSRWRYAGSRPAAATTSAGACCAPGMLWLPATPAPSVLEWVAPCTHQISALR